MFVYRVERSNLGGEMAPQQPLSAVSHRDQAGHAYPLFLSPRQVQEVRPGAGAP